MKISKEQVRSEKQVIGIAEVPEYETLQEAIAALSEAKCLSLINTQNGTNIKNEIRSGFAAKPSKQSMSERAMTELVTSTEDVNAIRAVLADPTKRQEYVDKKIAEYTTEWETKRAERAAEMAKTLGENGGEGNE